jgi:hypothetical protein
MGFHKRTGKESLLRMILMEEPALYTALRRTKALGRIVSMATAWVPQGEVQKLFANRKGDEGTVRDKKSAIGHSGVLPLNRVVAALS